MTTRLRAGFLILALLLALAVVTIASAATFIGTNGDDVRNGTWGDDYFDMKPGDDAAFGKGGVDEIRLGEGEDVGYGAQGSDAIYGGDQFDRLYAGCNGVCPAGPNNFLYGGNGNDQLAAQNGERDLVDGGPHTDTCWLDTNDNWTSCEIRHFPGHGFAEEPTVSTEQ